MAFKNITPRQIVGISALIVIVLAGVLAMRWFDLPEINTQTVDLWVQKAGIWGPVLIIGFMTLAIVASPIPSAPIAMVAGATYGHLAGAIYVAIGAELGAVIAFLIARYAGRNAVRRILGENADYGLLGSQNALTLAVFGSRLLPFISFDAISYAAGLSKLHLWRFFLATLAGILPASFVLAHVGAGAIEGDYGASEWIVLGLGLITAIPIILFAVRGRKAAKKPDGCST
jgi:uncharacterized membrane protein YdjX (TVP38/TMEM64 family)